jgi:hypothetical protein
MGKSISERTHKTIEANRDAGRLCANAETHCRTAANIIVTQDFWSTQVGVGSSRSLEMTMCEKHASRIPTGYRGRNFIVTSHQNY